MNHGGAREGAGRKVGYRKPESESRTTALSIRLTPAERAKAERIGNANASKGLRRALDAYVSD